MIFQILRYPVGSREEEKKRLLKTRPMLILLSEYEYLLLIYFLVIGLKEDMDYSEYQKSRMMTKVEFIANISGLFFFSFQRPLIF